MKIIIEGIIGWDITAKDIREQLAGAKSPVDVEIASPGGSISEGLLIYNELKNFNGTVNTHLTGVVASMATYISLVGEKRTAENNAVFMIHNGSSVTWGDHREMFKMGKHLNSLTNMIAKEYAAKTGTQLEELRTAMDDETFYYGDEIKEAGFVHEMIGDDSEEDRDESVALAEMMISECENKINTPEMVKKDFEALAVMMAEIVPDVKNKMGVDQSPDNVETEQEEVVSMTYEELKAKHPDVFAVIRDEGMAAGVESERGRVKGLTEMRAKFTKPHSQKVIDMAIAEGHDLSQVSINLMAADQAAAELNDEIDNDTKTPGNDGVDDVPEMKDNVMSHPDHLDAQSSKVANMIGMGAK